MVVVVRLIAILCTVVLLVSGREVVETVFGPFGGYCVGMIPSLYVIPINSVFHVGPLELLELLMVTILEMCVTTLPSHIITRFITTLLSADTVRGTFLD